MVPYPSSAFAASQLLPRRRLFSVAFTMDPALATGVYYLLILANGLLGTPGTPPANTTDLTATAGLLLLALPVNHTLNNAETISINAADYGYPSETGWRPMPHPPADGTRDAIEAFGFMFLISSTVPTNFTTVGAHVWTNATGE